MGGERRFELAPRPVKDKPALFLRKQSKMNQDKLEKRVWFPGWAGVLAQEPWPPAQREAFRRIIAWYLHACRERG
jgi:hypothetical protein